METKQEMILDGLWKISSDMREYIPFVASDYDDSNWLDINVPSHWQTKPEFSDYPEEMLYRKTFQLPNHQIDNRQSVTTPCSEGKNNKKVFLRFEGVFYDAKIWLNTDFIGEHKGYFSPFEFDITDKLKNGENILAVYVKCKWEKDINNKKQIMGVFAHWDCKPNHIQPGGIWNSVKIIEKNYPYIQDVKIGDFQIDEERNSASTRLSLTLSSEAGAYCLTPLLDWTISPYNFSGNIQEGAFNLPDSKHISHQTEYDENTDIEEISNTSVFLENSSCSNGQTQRDVPTILSDFDFNITINNPSLWSTSDIGKPNLYTITVTLKNSEGYELDRKSIVFGIRTLEFKDWKFYLNGKRLFLRGSNYPPCNIRIADVKISDYERDVNLMLEANLNMIRIHAHIEKDEFYSVCDKKGILVWQDFPLQWFYAKEIEQDAVKQIKEMVSLLYSHPSIAVWCCHNEPSKFEDVQQSSSILDILKKENILDYLDAVKAAFIGNFNKDVLDHKLTDAVKSVDTTRPIIPYSGVWDFQGSGINIGKGRGKGTDTHIYFGWYMGQMRHIELLINFYKKSLRFVTEYGAQSFPVISNFQKIQDAASIEEIDWENLRTNNMLQKNIMDKFVRIVPEMSLEEYIEATQIYQARLIKFHNETFRMFKYAPCGGALQFMFTDCCPAITWSVVDYWRTSKKAFYTLKESFQPLYIFIEPFPKKEYKIGSFLSAKVFIANDLHKNFYDAVAEWKLLCCRAEHDNKEHTAHSNEDTTRSNEDTTRSNALHWNAFVEEKRKINIPEDSIQKICKFRWDFKDIEPGNYKIYLSIKNNEEILTENIYTLKVV